MPSVPGNPAPEGPQIPEFWYDLAIANMIEMGRLGDPDRLGPGGLIEPEGPRSRAMKEQIERFRDLNEQPTDAPPLHPFNERFDTDQLGPGWRTQLKLDRERPPRFKEVVEERIADDKRAKEIVEKWNADEDPIESIYRLSPAELRRRGYAK